VQEEMLTGISAELPASTSITHFVGMLDEEAATPLLSVTSIVTCIVTCCRDFPPTL
jgi:hypothetical protein